MGYWVSEPLFWWQQMTQYPLITLIL